MPCWSDVWEACMKDRYFVSGVHPLELWMTGFGTEVDGC